MKRVQVDGVQNVEVSKKIPCIKPLSEQLEIMELYTKVHKESLSLGKEQRELNCLKVLYPTLFQPLNDRDLIAGRLDFLPIGFGCVTSVGGVGHYCVFNKLRDFQKQLPEIDQPRVQVLYDYWLDHDVKSLYCQEMLDEIHAGRFVDCKHPFLSTARLSGMMLKYDLLLDEGIEGLKAKILAKESNAFLSASYQALTLLQEVIDFLKQDSYEKYLVASDDRKDDVYRIYQSLEHIQYKKPETFHQALQLFWVYALIAGCINYGRLDDVLGPFVCRDMENGILTEAEAIRILKSLWLMIENRRTTVNGRIIVGGKGRKHPKEADVFTRLALQVTKECRYVEPQFTLRFASETPEDIMDMAYDCIGMGATYPTLYNDDVNVPAVMYGMRVDYEAACQYVPFGCGEFVIQGQSVGTPNTVINLLKIMNMSLHEGVDPYDGIDKSANVDVPNVSTFTTFEEYYQSYLELLDYYLDLSIEHQYRSYEIMNQEVSFLYASILMDDCIARGKALLDGGVRYLGGTNETYGNINVSDALFAIKTLVFDEKKYTLPEMVKAMDANFVGYEKLHRDIMKCHKYGNDEEDVDTLANDFYEYVAKGVRDRGIAKGMQYYLIVISNNQMNTEWGRMTTASLDGRKDFMFMNPANNPVGGANVSGPTALLNSLAKFDAKYHGGSVQNIKFTPSMFNEKREVIKHLFRTYFDKGGCHLMVTVVDHGVLQDAKAHPEKYPNLIVRVSGFSAVFVHLESDVQDELISRVLYG